MVFVPAVSILLVLGHASASFERDVVAPISMKQNLPNLKGVIGQFNQVSHGRRLQAGMSEECEAKCKGANDFTPVVMTKMGEIFGQTDKDDLTKFIEFVEALCPYKEVMECMNNEMDCQDDKTKDLNAPDEMRDSMMCMCTCPAVKGVIKGYGSGDMQSGAEAFCADAKGLLSCLGSTRYCKKMKMDFTEQGKKSDRAIELECEAQTSGCNKKMEGMMTCVGEEKMTTYGMAGCDADLKTASPSKTTECCPIMKEIGTCLTKECIAIWWAAEMEKGEFERSGNARMSAACPSAGLPTTAEVTAKKDGVTGGDNAVGDGWAAAPGWALLAGLASYVAGLA